MQFERKTFDAQPYVYVEKTCDYSEIAQNMGDAFGAVFGFFSAHGITPLSAPMSLYTDMPSGASLTFPGRCDGGTGGCRKGVRRCADRHNSCR